MLLPCEVGVKTVLPAIRALMARAIMEKHGLKEKQAAEILGSSQSAISRYTTRNRGNILSIENVPEVQTLIDQMITFLITKPEQKIEVLKLFCQACTIIRQKGLMCNLCQQNKNNKAWIETCDFCRTPQHQENSNL